MDSMNPYIQALHILAIGTVGGIVFSALLYLVTTEPTWWPWYKKYTPEPLPPATYAPTSARYMPMLQRIADNMREEATIKRKSVGYGHREIGKMELVNNGVGLWTLRVRRPTKIPRSRYRQAFRVPAGTPEQQTELWVWWHWAETVERPLHLHTTALTLVPDQPRWQQEIPLIEEDWGGLGAALYWRIRQKCRYRNQRRVGKGS